MSAQAIAQYFAQVGILVDNRSIASVDSYLNRVEKSMNRFQNRLEKSTRFNIRFNVDRTKITRAIQTTLNSVAKNKDVKLDIGKINVKTQSIVNQVNRDFKEMTREGRGIKLDARFSQRSLVAMKKQFQDYMKTISINPRITATLAHNISQRVARASVRSANNPRRVYSGSDTLPRENPTSSRRMNPYHNPMMVGGSIGAVMRYGAYALPLYGGVVGINAMANRVQDLQGQSLGLKVATESVEGVGGLDAAHYERFLAGLGKELGLKTQDLTPYFAQMLAGSRGTDLEPHLEKGFGELMRFSTVMGIDNESTKLTIKAFSQMILK